MKKMKYLLLLTILMCPFSVYAYSSKVIVGGQNIGIELNSKGVLVIGFYKINGEINRNKIEVGDYITKVNNIEINSINELVSLIDKYQSNGHIPLTIKRANKEINIDFTLKKENDLYKTGLYVKDSISGIGTLTYIDPNTSIYGALGHEIIDSITNSKIEVNNGKIFKSVVTSIDRSVNGVPGTKNARFYSSVQYGNILKNTNHGIYGKYNEVPNSELTEVGNVEEIKLGDAVIRTVTNDETVSEYKIKITRIDKSSSTKNIYFEITDEELLNKAGGIVQGMSGSPILQNNKIIGAVTHVVIENVHKGYGVFITTMLNEGEK